MTKYAGKKPYPFKPGDDKTGQCSACGEAFYGEESFDWHRRGEGPGRHCIDPAKEPPSKTGRRYWYDNQGRWHYGEPINPNDYDARLRARAEQLRTARQESVGRARSAQQGAPGVLGTPDPQRSPERAVGQA